jgi:glycerate 2-kinase
MPSPALPDDIRPIIDAALAAVDPRSAVLAQMVRAGDTLHIGARAYTLSQLDRILVVGAGKAGAPMVGAINEILGDRICAGYVAVKYGYMTHTSDGPITLQEAGHPVPDAAGLVGAQQIARLLDGLTARDLVIVLLSGGGSALLPLPASGLDLADLQGLTNVLLRCGATINEMNAARKHCSQLQGGGLARLAAPAQVAALILSDVVGSPLDTIASGPTVPDASTFADVLALLARYGVTGQIPKAILTHFERGAAGQIAETPKPGDPLFAHVNNVIVGDNASAAHAAVTEAQRRGWHGSLLTTFVQGEAREVGRVMAGLAQGVASGASDFTPPVCLVCGGETTVTIRGDGLGGRNQEMALSAAIALDAYPLPADRQIAIVCLATDGSDGPTDAAGGIVTPNTVARGRARNLDARAALAANDSYHYLAAAGALLVTGPTHTNVNDLVLIFIR